MVVQRKYPDELRERAVKMVLEVREREGKGHGELARIASMPWNLRPAASGLSPSVGPCRPGPVPGTLEPPYLHPPVTASVRFLGFTVMIAVVGGCLSPLPVP